MACDFRIAATKAKLRQPVVNLHLISGYAPTQPLTILVGMDDALYLLIYADMINAKKAFEIKLVQKVVEQEILLDQVLNIAENIAQKDKNTVKLVKKIAYKEFNMPF